ncbi:MAG: hypothetical protein QM727_07040 [Niabella sp.]
MKKSIFMLALSGFLFTAAYAQDGPARGEGQRGPRMAMQMDSIYKEIGCSSEQIEKLKAVDDASRKQMMALREDSNLSREDRMSKMRDIREEQTKKRNAILTKEQVEKLDKKMEDMRGNRRPGGGRPSNR